MGKVITHFHSIECNGPAPTPLFKHCPTVARGDWDEATVEANAIAAGWTTNGPKWLCPICSPVITDGAPAKAPKTSRVPKPVEQPQPEQQEQHQ